MQFLKIIVFIFILFSIGYSLFKILRQTPIQAKNESVTFSSPSHIYSSKNIFYVPLANATFIKEINLVVGKNYSIIETGKMNNETETCFLGILKLSKKTKEKYIFESKRALANSKLQNYIGNVNVLISEKQDNFSNKHLFNCKNWIKIINHKNMASPKITKIQKPNIHLNVHNCLNISTKNYLSIESYSSKIINLNYNQLLNKLKVCSKNIGSSVLLFHPSDGRNPFYVNFLSVQKKNKNEFSPKNKKRPLFHELTFPGWL